MIVYLQMIKQLNSRATVFGGLTMFFSMLELLFLSLMFHGAYQAALDEYVYRPDPYYKFEEIGKQTGPGYTMYMINMTSQKWKTGTENIFSFFTLKLLKQMDIHVTLVAKSRNNHLNFRGQARMTFSIIHSAYFLRCDPSFYFKFHPTLPHPRKIKIKWCSFLIIHKQCYTGLAFKWWQISVIFEKNEQTKR